LNFRSGIHADRSLCDDLDVGTSTTATANHILPNLLNGPPQANAVWVRGPEDIVDDKWDGKTVVDYAVINRCKPDEWLLIEAWDES
jgi:hypothetical protein